ncbi:ryncolin-4-like [Stylophora pistillata]|nr:ryncolin-4-like [Stylophora pistillata]
MDFNRTWNEYKKGFGDFLIREFWLGLDKIQRLTQNKTENKLRVDLGVAANESVYAEYKWFGIGNEKALYQLHIGKFSSQNVHDSLSAHNGTSFGTRDKLSADSCPSQFGGGWWYGANKACESNLNGIRPHREDSPSIHWTCLKGCTDARDNAPRTTEMKIRPVHF